MAIVIGVITFFLTSVLCILSLPWIVFFLSYVFTIGHWENEQYRWPALILTLVMAASGITLAVLNIWLT